MSIFFTSECQRLLLLRNDFDIIWFSHYHIRKIQPQIITTAIFSNLTLQFGHYLWNVLHLNHNFCWNLGNIQRQEKFCWLIKATWHWMQTTFAQKYHPRMLCIWRCKFWQDIHSNLKARLQVIDWDLELHYFQVKFGKQPKNLALGICILFRLRSIPGWSFVPGCGRASRTK